MPWYEFQPCHFEVTPNGLGEPSLLHMEFSGGKPSLLPQKLIGRVYFELRRGLSWSEAEAVAEELNKAVTTMWRWPKSLTRLSRRCAFGISPQGNEPWLN